MHQHLVREVGAEKRFSTQVWNETQIAKVKPNFQKTFFSLMKTLPQWKPWL